MLRIGKADWNYFSNYVYGVQGEIVEQYDTTGNSGGHETETVGKISIGTKMWDVVVLEYIEVVSTYCPKSERTSRLKMNSAYYTPLWQNRLNPYGVYPEKSVIIPAPDHRQREPFFPVRMKAKILSTYKKEYDGEFGYDVYRTFMFGGTICEAYHDKKENERFLEAQMKALKKVIYRHFRDIGFSDESPAS
ncbi:MAG: hypothetical protein JW881_21745 [Spirochaetales bacterium]|nr:hypothetical protein [Spirochaetales bacterium]